MSCNEPPERPGLLGYDVSIPIGFSNELQRGRHPLRDLDPGRFNPYRVFQ